MTCELQGDRLPRPVTWMTTSNAVVLSCPSTGPNDREASTEGLKKLIVNDVCHRNTLSRRCQLQCEGALPTSTPRLYSNDRTKPASLVCRRYPSLHSGQQASTQRVHAAPLESGGRRRRLRPRQCARPLPTLCFLAWIATCKTATCTLTSVRCHSMLTGAWILSWNIMQSLQLRPIC